MLADHLKGQFIIDNYNRSGHLIAMKDLLELLLAILSKGHMSGLVTVLCVLLSV